VDRLKASGVIRAEPTDFGFDRPGLTYFSSKTLPYRFSSAEWAILTYVADRFAGKNLRHILEVAYETEPFKVARPDGKGVSLPMSLVDNQGTDANGGISIGDVLEGKQAISEGDWTDLGDWERGIQGTA
jgi:hypothetical protein